MKKNKKEESLFALKIELAITVLLFIMMMSAIIFAFVMIARGGYILQPPIEKSQSSTQTIIYRMIE